MRASEGKLESCRRGRMERAPLAPAGPVNRPLWAPASPPSRLRRLQAGRGGGETRQEVDVRKAGVFLSSKSGVQYRQKNELLGGVCRSEF